MRIKKSLKNEDKKIKETSFSSVSNTDEKVDINLPPKKEDDFPYKTHDARLIEKLQKKFNISEVTFDATVGMRLFTINAPRTEVENYIREEVR